MGDVSLYYFHCCSYSAVCALLHGHIPAKLFSAIGGIFIKIQMGRRGLRFLCYLWILESSVRLSCLCGVTLPVGGEVAGTGREGSLSVRMGPRAAMWSWWWGWE